MTDIATRRQQLKIKSGVVDRLFKEAKVYYPKEIESLEKKRTNLVAEGEVPGEWALKNNSKMIDESKRMVDDATTRLNGAVDALETVIAKAKEIADMSDDEVLRKAENILQKVKGTGNDKQSKMIDESKKVVDDATKRLNGARAVDALEIAKAKEITDLSDDEELHKAENILQEVKGTGNDSEVGENTSAL